MKDRVRVDPEDEEGGGGNNSCGGNTASGGSPDPLARPNGGPDLDNARAFVKHQGKNIRYVPQFKGWLIWNGMRWRLDDTRAIERLAKETVDAMLVSAMAIKNQDKRERAIKAAIGCRARKKIMDMITLAESEKEVIIAANKLDADPDLLGVMNGVLDLKTGDFIAPRRDLYITKACAVAYDPDAKCPEWDKSILKITHNDAKLVSYLARVMGYALTGSVAEEIAFLLWGSGKNGKTTFRETLYRMLDDYAVAGKASMLTAEERAGAASPDVARLKGARVLAINEMTEGAKINEERFKYLTGNDTLNARELHKPPFDFPASHKTIITTNYKPKIKDTDEGIWRKIHLVPLRGADFRQREDRELPRSTAHARAARHPELGAGRAHRITRKQGIAPPEVVTRATQNYRNAEDVIAQWFSDCCERDDRKDDKGVFLWETSSKALLASLKEWVLDQEDMPSSQRLGRWFENQNFKAGRDSKGAKWKGVKLKDADTGTKSSSNSGRSGYKEDEDYVEF